METKTEIPSPVILYLRSLLFSVWFVVSLMGYAIFAVFTFPLPYNTRYRLIVGWPRMIIWWLKITCKINYEVKGMENVPKTPCMVMSNHQSTWETMFLASTLPPLVWVVKRELLWVPFFGWGLAVVQPIALNRGAGRKAVEQLAGMAKNRLQLGRWLIIFPEGTRVPVGKKRPYKVGGAVVAASNEVPILPVAHNAGCFWPRKQFLKYPGTVEVEIGEPIGTKGKQPEDIIKEVQDWIQPRVEKLVSKHLP